MIEIHIEGPGKNALSTPVLTRLRDALRAAGDAPVLLTGAGDAFSAGLDLKEVASLGGDAMKRFLQLLEETMQALFLYPGPTVACVNGHAIAGGCVLSLCCDYRVGARSSRSRIGLNEVALGLRFPPIVWNIVRSRIPAHHRATVLLGAGLHDFDEAYHLGLLDELSDDAPTRARVVLETYARHPRDAYSATKRSLREGVVAITPDEAQGFLDEVVPLWASDESKARILSVLKK